ncbi:MAG: DinB family protein [Planctomycetaceae bacterium]|jgi:hypothetical protein|nr:DinB family protein [Planctomycetaceae bacterium]
MKDNNSEDIRNAILFQFDMAWQLLEYHFVDIDDDECLWKPCENGLHVYCENGVWRADFPTREGYDVGPPSIAWITWHIIFWWSMVFDYSFWDGVLIRESVFWSGSADAAKKHITQLHDKWRDILKTMPAADFCSSKQTKYPFADKPFYELAMWLNLELIKNTSEIGYCRFLYAAQNHDS